MSECPRGSFFPPPILLSSGWPVDDSDVEIAAQEKWMGRRTLHRPPHVNFNPRNCIIDEFGEMFVVSKYS